MPFYGIRVALVIATSALSSEAYCQMKIDQNLDAALRESGKVKVLIVTRPDPDAGGNTAASTASLSQALGAGSNVKPIGELPVVAAEINVDQLYALKDNPNVALVTPDNAYPPTLSESGPLVGATKVHQNGVTGSGYSVAVLDTGVQRDHPALKDSIIAEACFSTKSAPGVDVTSLCPGGYEVSTVAGAASKCPYDLKGCEHGTHVAGIVAGHGMQLHGGAAVDGIAPAAKIIAVQVFSRFSDSGSCSGQPPCILSFTSDQLRALEWVYKQREQYHVAAVNMSLGGGYHDTNCDQSSALTEIIERLKSKGVATVIAAGNDDFYDGISEPACISSAVSVSALDKNDQLDVTYTNVARLVHISAPGTGIVSSIPGGKYDVLSGTSMAAPHVAAAFALLRQMYPHESTSQLERRLVTNATLAVDPRTDTKIPVLELAHTLPDAATAAGTAATPAAPPSSPAGMASGNSFILKSTASENQITKTLSDNCLASDCELKKIGKDTYKLDIQPSEQLSGNDLLTNHKLEGLVKSVDPDAAIFRNGMSKPFR